MAEHVVGIDLGGTHMQIGVVDPSHRIIGRARGQSGADGVEAVVDRMVEAIDEACRDAGVAVSDLLGVGVGAPAPIDPTFRIALHAVNLRWNDVPLAAIMTERLGGVPVTLDNDVNAAVWGEVMLGAGRGFSNVIGLWVGTGIGGGIVLNGRLHHGTFGTAGECGRGVFYPQGGPSFRLYEEVASRKAIIDAIQRLLRTNARSILPELAGGIDRINIAHVVEAIRRDDELAIEVCEHSAFATGVVAANAVTLLSLDCVILGGGAVEALGDWYVQRVRRTFDKYVFPEECRRCEIRMTHLEDNAGLLGAALLARERLA